MGWSPWGDWDTCTRTCGGGMQARARSILQQERHGGKPCEGDPQEMQGCPICKDHPRYARFCPTWTIYCSNSEFVKGCCKVLSIVLRIANLKVSKLLQDDPGLQLI